MLTSMLDQDAPEMAAMLDCLGVERSEVVARSPGMTSVAITNCIRCPDKAICKAWQTGADDHQSSVPTPCCFALGRMPSPAGRHIAGRERTWRGGSYNAIAVRV